MLVPSRRFINLTAALFFAVGSTSQAAWGRDSVLEPKYPQVFSLIHVDKQTDEAESVRFRDQQARRIKSMGVLDTALRDNPRVRKFPVLNEQVDAREWLVQHVRVRFIEETGVIRVWLDDGSPREQAVVVSAVTKAYFKDVVDHHRRDCENKIHALELRKEKASLMEIQKGELKKWSGIKLLEAPRTSESD